MAKLTLPLILASASLSTAAVASHDSTVPYPTRGACESASAQQNIDDWDFVMEASWAFSTRGVRSLACLHTHIPAISGMTVSGTSQTAALK
jgi:hypothetical protein